MKSEKQKKKRKQKSKQIKGKKIKLNKEKKELEKLTKHILKLSKKIPANMIPSDMMDKINSIRVVYMEEKKKKAWELADFVKKINEEVKQKIEQKSKENEKELNQARKIAILKEIDILEEHIKDNNL